MNEVCSLLSNALSVAFNVATDMAYQMDLKPWFLKKQEELQEMLEAEATN